MMTASGDFQLKGVISRSHAAGVSVPPMATQQCHFHTGHVIEPKKKVIVFTDANPPAGEHYSVSLNGYLAAVKVVGARK